jgi:hypothetical protein
VLVLRKYESEISIYSFNIAGRASDEYAAILYHTFLNTNTIYFNSGIVPVSKMDKQY